MLLPNPLEPFKLEPKDIGFQPLFTGWHISCCELYSLSIPPFGNLEETFPHLPQAGGVRWEVPKL